MSKQRIGVGQGFVVSAGHLQVAVVQPAQVAGYSVWHLAAGHFALVLVGPPAE